MFGRKMHDTNRRLLRLLENVLSDPATFYDAHADAVYAFVLHLTGAPEEARDVVQAVFVRVLGRPALAADVISLRPWLLRIAHREVLDRARSAVSRARREEAAAAGLPLFLQAPDPDVSTFHQALASALETLPPDQRAVVHLKLWEDFTFDAIATTLDISRNTAASRYRLAIASLQRRLRPIYDEIR